MILLLSILRYSRNKQLYNWLEFFQIFLYPHISAVFLNIVVIITVCTCGLFLNCMLHRLTTIQSCTHMPHRQSNCMCFGIWCTFVCILIKAIKVYNGIFCWIKNFIFQHYRIYFNIKSYFNTNCYCTIAESSISYKSLFSWFVVQEYLLLWPKCKII